jgi:HEAT repeat protein
MRRLAAELLGELDAPEARSALVRGVHDADLTVRSTALRALAAAGSPVEPGEITGGLDDDAPQVRRAALEALRALTDDPAPARRLLIDRDKLVRADAAAILLEHGRDAEAEEALLTLTAAREPAARAAALRALAAARVAGSGDLALDALSDPAASVRAQAARSAAVLDPDRAVEPLVAAMADESGEVIEAVAGALAEIGEATIPSVRRFAAGSVAEALASERLARSIDPDGSERRELLRDSLLARAERHALAAIRATALLGDRSAIGTAIESLSVADPAQRANALEVIETLGEREVVRPLLALWEPDRPLERDGRWLERLLHDPDDWIRACARFASTEPAPGSRDDATDETSGGAMTETMTTLSLMERVLFLRKVPLFADLPPHDLQPIAEVATEHSYEEGDTIAEQGEPGEEMYIIVAGYVMVILREPGGHLRVLAVRSAGEVIGEMAVITSAPRMAALAARGPVRLLTIGRRQFEAILRERPETSLAVMRVLCQRLADREADAPGLSPGSGP